jgi:hypothetical protein
LDMLWSEFFWLFCISCGLVYANSTKILRDLPEEMLFSYR